MLRGVALLILAGCEGSERAVEGHREEALQAAYGTGQIELSCPQATPRITSQQVVQAANAAARRFGFAVDVAGCGGETGLLIVCGEGSAPCAPARGTPSGGM